MKRTQGFTIMELLVAIAVIAVAFTALAQSQIVSLRTSVSQQDFTSAKATAVRTLEELSSSVLRTEVRTCLITSTGLAQPCTYYYFSEYRTACASATSTDSRCASAAGVSPSWRVKAETGPFGEDLILLTVTAKGQQGTSYTVAQRVSCFDVYPAPSHDTPAPCPAAQRMNP